MRLKSTKNTPVSKNPSKPISNKKLTFAELLESTGYKVPALKRGQEVRGNIVAVTPSEILVDIGAKAEGVIAGRELTAASDIVSKLSVGDKIDANVLYPENDAGQVVLSLRKLSQDVRWMELEEKKDTDEEIQVVPMEVNRGGVICDFFGIRGFLPASQLQRAPSKLADLIGKSLWVKIIEVDRKTNRLIFSQKQPDIKDLDKIQGLLKQVTIGQKLSGTVTAVLPFGIFVEVEINKVTKVTKESKEPKVGETGKDEKTSDSSGHSTLRDEPSGSDSKSSSVTSATSKLEGLVHISEISWEKIEDVSKHFKVGDKVDVMVIAKDEVQGRLNLSVKQLSADPFLEISKSYTKDQSVSGNVARVTPYGVFVSLEGGVEGLIHISKIPPNIEYQVGQKVECTVESVETKSRRIALMPVVTQKPVLYR